MKSCRGWRSSRAATKFAWRSFSDDILHNTCGLHVVAKGEMIISTMDDLVRVKDTDNDGIADSYQVISDDWGITGNYHETNMLAPDGAGAKNGGRAGRAASWANSGIPARRRTIRRSGPKFSACSSPAAIYWPSGERGRIIAWPVR